MFLAEEKTRKRLLRSWALNWWHFTRQPFDEICSYYGMKVVVDIMLIKIGFVLK